MEGKGLIYQIIRWKDQAPIICYHNKWFVHTYLQNMHSCEDQTGHPFIWK